MASRFLRAVLALDLEERILNAGSLIAAVGVFLPWLSGEWLGGDPVTYSGLSFYTSFLGISVLLLHLFVLSVTVIPLTGGPRLLRARFQDVVRLWAAGQAAILVLAALSVLTKVTFEFSRVEVRFGIYVSMIGSLIVTLYSFLKLQEQRRREVHDLFHHPEDVAPVSERKESRLPLPPPPPPPPPLKAEEHYPHRRQVHTS